jgi:hypothetical protein
MCAAAAVVQGETPGAAVLAHLCPQLHRFACKAVCTPCPLLVWAALCWFVGRHHLPASQEHSWLMWRWLQLVGGWSQPTAPH